jgi:hypothetical protein
MISSYFDESIPAWVSQESMREKKACGDGGKGSEGKEESQEQCKM